ncbi:hypothetical protein B9Q04_10080 [Candidatus Marsarchaeota G2 archaeon BE_D]|jgi:hypothetical protein|uniref:Yip1 domain-containing protein n=4 Tax=Candidatus Marsarchaeota group 2 TaxID=2203771 RepID=A0A2R6C9L3_9ARCH|nr:MAG: hypothetical protein B9Q06_02170 [Candidatus Marsarchaeota G2 archaeon ECH_B_2]PSO01128.1 MAG: hypothetical protein B9Q07_01515 [Candidatus Marsarchaeota G2 archaeon ECH_B_3]PSO02987.1 MAG: hypothetical protein B9Q05_02750 [Candidatus Marsarchaeota G2 archaeon ECH_B_1]PSO07585.1 MAG: hypothetical protein B9Q04_10080 [Candidatus Marsarchaeota G2 archaeon BE_D]
MLEQLAVSGTLGLIVFLLGVIILWMIVSLPVYFASKVVKAGRSTMGGAMIATLVGPIVYFLVYAVVSFILGAIGVHTLALAVAFLLAFLAWIGVYKAVFNTGWLGAFGIAILAAVVYLILNAIFFTLFRVSFPGGRFLPIHFFGVGVI